MINKLAILETERNGSEGWTEWRKISNRKDYLEIAVNNIIKFEDWNSSFHIEIIKNYISPFNATDEEVLAIEEYIENRINNDEINCYFERNLSLKSYYENRNNDEIKKIEDRCNNATPGPWISFVEGRDHTSGSNFIRTAGDDIELIASVKDQDFIVSCRQDIPLLIDEIVRLRGILEENGIVY